MEPELQLAQWSLTEISWGNLYKCARWTPLLETDSVAVGEELKCKYFDNDSQLMLICKGFLH